MTSRASNCSERIGGATLASRENFYRRNARGASLLVLVGHLFVFTHGVRREFVDEEQSLDRRIRGDKWQHGDSPRNAGEQSRGHDRENDGERRKLEAIAVNLRNDDV